MRANTPAVDEMPFGDHRNVQWDPVTSTVHYDNSSRQYNENITPLRDDFAALLDARAMTYTRPARPDRWEIGYIAEEFHELGLKKLVDYDVEGRPDGINYEKICLYLTEIAKRQRREIDGLRTEKDAEIAELRRRLVRLEAAWARQLKGGRP